MRLGSQAMVAGSLLALGVGAFAIAGLGGEQQVVRVEDLVGALGVPDGKRVLLGVPQPALLPVRGESGVRLQENPDHPAETVRTVAWTADGEAWHAVLRLRAEQDGSVARFTLTNETRRAGQVEVATNTTATFTLEGLAVPVRAFDDGDGSFPVVWAVVPPSHVKEPLRDVPSQFEGRVAAVGADGAPIPAGAVVFQASSYKAGCSSKFLPEPERARQAASGEA
jgi:hypothetical protein